MEKNKLNVFMEKILGYPHLNSNQVTDAKNLFLLDEGIYILEETPTVDMIKMFPNFKGEFGLLLINSIWLLTVSYKEEAYIPIDLDNYISKGLVQFFAHSHPNDGNIVNLFPSFPDLESSDAVDHKIYIVSAYGITEVDITNADCLKGLEERWEDYMSYKRFSYEEYVQNPFKFYMNFLESIGCKLNIISFEKREEIENILNSKQQLQHAFWEKKANTTPFPGKKI